jgi:hypothetical protein
MNEGEFDTSLDDLYRQAVSAAQEFGWPVLGRAELEARYKKELAASKNKANERNNELQ